MGFSKFPRRHVVNRPRPLVLGHRGCHVHHDGPQERRRTDRPRAHAKRRGVGNGQGVGFRVVVMGAQPARLIDACPPRFFNSWSIVG
jgi:hypothetical protein